MSDATAGFAPTPDDPNPVPTNPASPTPLTPGAESRTREQRAADGSPTSRAHRSLLPYFLWLIATNTVLHLAIALTGNAIGWTAAIGTVVIALSYYLYLATIGRGLGHVRYGRLVAHAVTYAAVTGGFLLHAYVLFAIGAPAIRDAATGLDPGWAGATLAMGGFWMIGLLVHAFGAMMDRGFEGKRA